jgi:hypothetical protein
VRVAAAPVRLAGGSDVSEIDLRQSIFFLGQFSLNSDDLISYLDACIFLQAPTADNSGELGLGDSSVTSDFDLCDNSAELIHLLCGLDTNLATLLSPLILEDSS